MQPIAHCYIGVEKMDQKVTIYTLAEQLNMSVSAVSRAFNPNSKLSAEKRKIILEAAEKYGYVQNKMASRLSQDPIRIGILMRGRIQAYYSHMLDGINAAYREFQNYKVTCDIRTFSPGEFTIDGACQVLDEFMAQKYDGVILHGLYYKDIVDKVNQLSDAGIKVVTLHNDLPVSKRLFTSTTNIEYTARMVAQLFDIFLPPEKRNILIFSGSMQSPIHQGLIFSLSKYSADYKLHLLQHFDTLDLPEFAEQLVAEAFATYSDINAIYISSANSIPICRYVESHGLKEQIVIIASDVFDELNAYINDGTVNATIFQDPFAQGYNAFAKLYYNIAENIEVPSLVTTTPQIILKSNLPLYL
jgi:LacI family transcriptional regulator